MSSPLLWRALRRQVASTSEFMLIYYQPPKPDFSKATNLRSLSSGRCGNIQRYLRSDYIGPYAHHLLSLRGIVPSIVNRCQGFSENSLTSAVDPEAHRWLEKRIEALLRFMKDM